MKKREGFVGNSSSSSFIIPQKYKAEAIHYGLDLIEPKDSIKRLKEIKKSIEKNKDNISSFLFDCKWRIEELDESIKKLEIFEKENKDCF